MKIALLGDSFISWGGGIDFLRNLANALLKYEGQTEHNLYLFIPQESQFIDTLNSIFKPVAYAAIDILNARKPQFRIITPFDNRLVQNSFKNIEGKIEVVVYKNSRRHLISCLEKIKVDVIIPSAISLGKNFPVPWFGYLYDFQHKYYPKFFSREVRYRRDIVFKKILTDARAAIVNSNTVKNDIEKFIPEANCQIFNLPFAPVPVMSWLEEPEEDVFSKYKLPKNYFLISNQFWIHKSHITAFEALKQFRDEKGSDVSIVCTGNTYDNRFPSYFQQLQNRITELEIDEFVHFLGFIPKEDQIQVMKHSIAVLQPTLFEGGPGGGAVYDAVAMGVPAIVSDIPVNKEIGTQEGVLFFQSESSTDLADKMFIISGLKGRTIVHEQELIDRGNLRAAALGDRLYEAIEYVMK